MNEREQKLAAAAAEAALEKMAYGRGLGVLLPVGAAAGGLAGATTAKKKEDALRRALIGAAAGGGLGFLTSRGVSSGRSGEGISKSTAAVLAGLLGYTGGRTIPGHKK